MLSRRGSSERPAVERRVTQLPVFPPATRTGRIYGGGNTDGVFANMSAKPVAGEEVDEKPPVSFAENTARTIGQHTDTFGVDIRTSSCRCRSSVLGKHHLRT